MLCVDERNDKFLSGKSFDFLKECFSISLTMLVVLCDRIHRKTFIIIVNYSFYRGFPLLLVLLLLLLLLLSTLLFSAVQFVVVPMLPFSFASAFSLGCTFFCLALFVWFIIGSSGDGVTLVDSIA